MTRAGHERFCLREGELPVDRSIACESHAAMLDEVIHEMLPTTNCERPGGVI